MGKWAGIGILISDDIDFNIRKKIKRHGWRPPYNNKGIQPGRINNNGICIYTKYHGIYLHEAIVDRPKADRYRLIQ